MSVLTLSVYWFGLSRKIIVNSVRCLGQEIECREGKSIFETWDLWLKTCNAQWEITGSFKLQNVSTSDVAFLLHL